MEDKQVVIRQKLGLRTTTPAAATTTASGILVSGFFVGDGVDVSLTTVENLYGTEFEYSDGPYGIRLLNDMYVAGTFNVWWGGSFYPKRSRIEICVTIPGVDTEIIAGETYVAASEPGGDVIEHSSGAFGPLLLKAGTAIHAVMSNSAEDPEHVELGAMWQAPGVYVDPGS